MQTAQPTLIQTLWPAAGRTWLRNAVLAVLGSLAIAISAKVQVPFYPVPMTMQTFVILALAMAMGWRLGGATVALYLAEGAMGLPVFAGTPEKGIGVAYMVGPTGGYLAGYLAAAVAVGWLGERGWDRNVLTAFAAMLVGMLLIYAPGVLWLGALLGWDKPILAWGLYPFVLGDLTKMALACAALPLAWKAVGRTRT